MSTSADRAADLRAQADALDQLADLEADLEAAKAAVEEDPSPEARTFLRAAMLALRETRAQTRTEGVTVGGDAYKVEEV